MERRKSRLKLKAKALQTSKEVSSSLWPETVGGLKGEGISEKESAEDQVIEISDESDRSGEVHQNDSEGGKKGAECSVGTGGRTDVALETLQESLLDICNRKKQMCWDALSDLLPYQQPVIIEKDDGISLRSGVFSDGLFPLPKLCCCMMLHKRRQWSTWAPPRLSVSTADSSANSSFSSANMLPMTVSVTSAMGAVSKQKISVNNTDAMSFVTTSSFAAGIVRDPSTSDDMAVKQKTSTGDNSGTGTKPPSAVLPVTPSGSKLTFTVPQMENYMSGASGTDPIESDDEDFEMISDVPVASVTSKTQVYSKVFGTSIMGNSQQQTDCGKAWSSDNRAIDYKVVKMQPKSISSKPLISAQSCSDVRKRKSVSGHQKLLMANPAKKMSRIETFLTQMPAGTYAPHAPGNENHADQSATKTVPDPSLSEGASKSAKEQKDTITILTSCPLCQIPFAAGSTQMDIDGHIALCLSATSGDVMWGKE